MLQRIFRRSIVLSLAFVMTWGVHEQASATVLAQGEIGLSISTNATLTPRYGYSSGLFSSLTERVSGVNTTQYYYLDRNDGYRGAGVLGPSQVSGEFDISNGSSSFNYSLTNPNPGVSADFASGSADMFANVSFTGVLSGFSYNYALIGSKDSAIDSLQFMIQMEVALYDPNLSRYVNVYSDYGGVFYSGYESNFRTNWVNETVQGETFATSGINTFDDYSALGTQSWRIRYDLQSSGRDNFGPSSVSDQTVPEPATLVLLALALLLMHLISVPQVSRKR
ncbi:MAG: hypothetical protein CVU19_14925 [Betaproteobacteria bacterium HGW-Betaproteobacteria-13]|jgi:hypothetical protein|nr:MAG: hypothetical protein CVU19_14925 [Betaproteobacteria bacterium HGW-Betaproteobacteria-13]